MKKKLISILSVVALSLCLALTCATPLTANATESTGGLKGNYVYNFTATSTTGNERYDVCIKSEYPVVGVATYQQKYEKNVKTGFMSSDQYGYTISFFTLNDDGQLVYCTLYKTREFKYNYDKRVYELVQTHEYGDAVFKWDNSNFFPSYRWYFESKGSGLKFLNYSDREVEYNSANDSFTYSSIGYDNVLFYLVYGKIKSVPEGTDAYALSDTSKLITGSHGSKNYNLSSTSDSFSLNDVRIKDDGTVMWNSPLITKTCRYKGVSVFYWKTGENHPVLWHRSVPMDRTLKVNIPPNSDITKISLVPFYVTVDGHVAYANRVSDVVLDTSAVYYSNNGSKSLFSVGSEQIVQGFDPKDDLEDGDGTGNGVFEDIENNDKDYYTETFPPEMFKENTLGYLQNVKFQKYTTGAGQSYIGMPHPYKYRVSWDEDDSRFKDAYIEIFASCTYNLKPHTIPVVTIEDNVRFEDATYMINGTELDAACYANGKTLGASFTVSYLYVRAVKYDSSTNSYIYGGLVRIDPAQLNAEPITTVKPNSNSTNLVPDNKSEDSYTTEDAWNNNDGGLDTDSITALTNTGFTWMLSSLKSAGTALGEFPVMVSSIFSFLPGEFVIFITIALGVAVVLRLLGR